MDAQTIITIFCVYSYLSLLRLSRCSKLVLVCISCTIFQFHCIIFTFAHFSTNAMYIFPGTNVYITKYGPPMGSCDKNAAMALIVFHQLLRYQAEKCRKLHEKPGKLNKLQRQGSLIVQRVVVRLKLDSITKIEQTRNQ